MKISEMTNDQAMEALIRISAPFENICNDEDVISSLDRIAGMNNVPPIKIIGAILPMITTVGFKKHRQDLYEIVGALMMVPSSKLGNMNFKETMKVLQDSYDEMLRDFFTSSAIVRKIAVKK